MEIDILLTLGKSRFPFLKLSFNIRVSELGLNTSKDISDCDIL